MKTSASQLYIAEAGTSVSKMLENIFTKELEPRAPTGASINVSMVTTAEKEVGTPVTPQYKITFSAGSMEYGSLDASGTWTSGTGITTTTLSVADSLGKEVTAATSGSTITAATSTVYKDTSDFVVTGYGAWTESNTPATNIHTPSKKYSKFAAGNSTKTATLVNGYRKMFGGSYVTPVAIDSSNVRALQNSLKAQVCTAEATKVGTGTFNVTIADGATQVLIAVPTAYKVTEVKDKAAFGTDVFAKFKTPVTAQVEGYGGYDAASYKVYEWTPDAALGSNEYGITVVKA